MRRESDWMTSHSSIHCSFTNRMRQAKSGMNLVPARKSFPSQCPCAKCSRTAEETPRSQLDPVPNHLLFSLCVLHFVVLVFVARAGAAVANIRGPERTDDEQQIAYHGANV